MKCLLLVKAGLLFGLAKTRPYDKTIVTRPCYLPAGDMLRSDSAAHDSSCTPLCGSLAFRFLSSLLLEVKSELAGYCLPCSAYCALGSGTCLGSW